MKMLSFHPRINFNILKTLGLTVATDDLTIELEAEESEMSSRAKIILDPKA